MRLVFGSMMPSRAWTSRMVPMTSSRSGPNSMRRSMRHSSEAAASPMRGCFTMSAGTAVRPARANSLSASGSSALEACIALAVPSSDVLERVLEHPVGAAVVAEDAKRRLLRDHVEERERRAVRHAVLAPGRDPGDGPRDHEADEDLVAFRRWQLREFEVHLCFRNWVPAFAGTTNRSLYVPGLAGVTAAPTGPGT